MNEEIPNQSPPRVDVDEFSDNAPLVDSVKRHDAEWALDSLVEVGRLVGSGQFQIWAELANTNPPELVAYDRYGARIDEVRYHPAYHEIIARAFAHGAHSSAWRDPGPGAHVARAACFMLFAQVEPGHACPVSMTYSAVPALRAEPALAAKWEPLITRNGYDPKLARADEKPGAIFGMAMTERQGGSDVRANTTTARPLCAGGRGNEYLLDGQKWFCSAPMSDGFLVLAQAEEGLSCFLVPRVLDDGSRNAFHLERLKDKLGNRSNASAEIELSDTIGLMVGEPGRGVATIIEMVNHTRLDCTLGTAAGMRQAAAEATWHAEHRSAFGRLLVDQPLMTNVLADLCIESEAATTVAIRLARAYDVDASDSEKRFRRIATAIIKYWVCKRGPLHAYEALECLGGNGYCETFPLARRYREQPVMSIWEGSGNVMCLDVLRAIARERESLEAFLEEVELAKGGDRLLDEHVSKLRKDLDDRLRSDDQAQIELQARSVVEDLALALQASLLVRFAPPYVADAFCAGRLGPERGLQFGSLPRWVDHRSVVQRGGSRAA
ncbi:MAG TPA: acyl-CoA dehydrogenase family protein [Acidimicrobiales bacterium]|nr:acyl-CoA dehydrogenase family protein [Acidimicrobiales bacterium]